MQLTREGTDMMKNAVVMLLALGAVVGAGAHENDALARFAGGIGVIPVQNGAGPMNADGTFPNVKLNVVRGVFPGAGPWRIADLRAEVSADGRIKVRGRALLRAGSNRSEEHTSELQSRLHL